MVTTTATTAAATTTAAAAAVQPGFNSSDGESLATPTIDLSNTGSNSKLPSSATKFPEPAAAISTTKL